jgi:hypothetical protein
MSDGRRLFLYPPPPFRRGIKSTTGYRKILLVLIDDSCLSRVGSLEKRAGNFHLTFSLMLKQAERGRIYVGCPAEVENILLDL